MSMAGTTGLMTAEEFYDFCHRPENRHRLYELERGEVVEMSRPGAQHGVACINVGVILTLYARQR
jgi:Uma2 family endonuclease